MGYLSQHILLAFTRMLRDYCSMHILPRSSLFPTATHIVVLQSFTVLHEMLGACHVFQDPASSFSSRPSERFYQVLLNDTQKLHEENNRLFIRLDPGGCTCMASSHVASTREYFNHPCLDI